jgi:protein-serine/threonine kinase
MDSRRSISFGFGKKRSGSITGSQTTTLQEKPRRFSLLPASFSLKSIGIGKDEPPVDEPYADERGTYLDPPQSAPQNQSRSISGVTATVPYTADGSYDRNRDSPQNPQSKHRPRAPNTALPIHSRFASQPISDPRSGAPPQFLPPMNFRQDQSALTTESESSLVDLQNRRQPFNEYAPQQPQSQPVGRGGREIGGRGVLVKNNRKFTEAYEQEPNNGYGPTHSDHAGSSGAARKVMDFFRRRGRERAQ